MHAEGIRSVAPKGDLRPISKPSRLEVQTEDKAVEGLVKKKPPPRGAEIPFALILLKKNTRRKN